MSTETLLKIGSSVQSIAGTDLTERKLSQLAAFHDLVLEWNQKINLVSRRDVEHLIERHLADSLAPLKIWDGLKLPPAPEVMDLGSGGGLPGIPLRICRSDIRLTCLEATKKKARFIETAAGELDLSNVTVVDKHSEEIKKDPAFKQRYDLVVCRAVAELKELIELSFPFLKQGGMLLSFKGQKAEEEVKSAGKTMKKLGMVLSGIYPYGDSGFSGRIVCLKK